MKKFLSLVLAMIMTMSLVTISAGATEYRDLTDKDEIQYEEAVAVLNRIGVITGYDDGSFRPEGELTRGAAAKIIVSLLIGPEAANNLPNATAPYPDVPASHTFAGVISYCKTAKIISGYGDGTFKPGNSLTGYAFAKMLLGALGYNQEIEGFVDTGWTMNVAKVGSVTGLFDRLDFDGSASVNREEACQLALNTLKATEVTYGGTTMVTGAQNMYVQGTQAMYKTSNNREINANINRRVISATNNELTLEFGEEHFKDLRLEHDKYDPAYDDYGRPSNEWSWKKVTIGTFKLPADFTYTTQIAYREDSQATKEKALGLRGYDTYSTDHRGTSYNWSSPLGGGSYTGVNSPFDDATQITINGWDARVKDSKTGTLVNYDAEKVTSKDGAPTLSEIADLTDNGVTVEVYVCPVDADFITNVVVVRTQLMKVKRIGSDYVTLDRIDPDSRDPRKDEDLAKITGYNAYAIDVDTLDVKDNNYDAYNTLKDLKAGDYVAVVPFTADQAKTWEVGEAYVPETVSGKLSDVGLYMNTSKTDGNATSITVGGTKYMINEWNDDMIDVKKAQINATRKDVTAYLAKDGTVLWATEIGNSDDWMIVGDYYQAANTNGKVVWFAHGWTLGGEEVNIDLGTIRGEAEKYAPGELVHYELATGGTGEYKLEKPNNTGYSSYYSEDANQISERRLQKTVDGVKVYSGEGVYNVAQHVLNTAGEKSVEYSIHPANSLIALEDYTNWKNPTTAATANGGKIHDKEYAYNYTTTYPAGMIDRAQPVATHEWNYRSTTFNNDGVKFIYVNFDSATGEVDYVSTRKDAQTVEYKELTQMNHRWNNVGTNANLNWVISPAEAYVNDDGNVEAVVIKCEPAEADLSNVIIVGEYVGTEYGKTGAESNPSNVSAREYWQGPTFSEKKTGYFKTGHNVGEIVVLRSTDANGVMDCKMFNGGIFENRNPDVFASKGIDPLLSATGAKSKIAFYVGKGTDSVYSQNNSINLKAMRVNDATVKADIMTDLKVEAEYWDELTELNNQGYDGLIKVAGAKWIDLRANRGSNEVESLGDLLDLDNDSVELHVLLNAKSSTDNFRRAYAIVVMQGQPKKSEAAISGMKIQKLEDAVYKDAVKGDGTSANHFVIEANTPGETVTLHGAMSYSGVITSSTWTVNSYTVPTSEVSWENNIKVPAPSTKDGKVTVAWTVAIRDDSKTDKPIDTKTVYADIVIKAETPAPTPATVTVTPAAGGTTTPATGLNVGDTFTLTVNDGYEYTSVSGATKAADSMTFTITDAAVTVTLTAKAGPEKDITVSGPTGAQVTFTELTSDGTATDKTHTATVGTAVKLPTNVYMRVAAVDSNNQALAYKNDATGRAIPFASAFKIENVDSVRIYVKGVGDQFSASWDADATNTNGLILIPNEAAPGGGGQSLEMTDVQNAPAPAATETIIKVTTTAGDAFLAAPATGLNAGRFVLLTEDRTPEKNPIPAGITTALVADTLNADPTAFTRVTNPDDVKYDAGTQNYTISYKTNADVASITPTSVAQTAQSVEVTIKAVAGKVVSAVSASGATAPDTITAANEVKVTLSAITGNIELTITTSDDANADPSTESMYAKVDTAVHPGTTTGTIKFYNFKGEAIPTDKVAGLRDAAIAKNGGTKPTSITEKDGIVTAKFTVNGTESTRTYALVTEGTAGAADKPNAVYKITIGDKSEYVYPEASPKTLKMGEEDKAYIWDYYKYVSQGDANAANKVLVADKDGVDITSTNIKTAIYGVNEYDLTFVEAVKLVDDATILGTVAGKVNNATAVVTVGTESEKIATLAANDYIVKGAKLQLEAILAAKASLMVTVNGATTPLSAKNESDKEDSHVKLPVIDVVGKGTTGNLILASSTGVKVFLNGTQLKTNDGKDYFSPSDTSVEVDKIPDGLVVIANAAHKTKIVADANTGGTAVIKTASVTAAGKGSSLDLTNVLAVKDTNGDVWLSTAYTFGNANNKIDSIASELDAGTVTCESASVTGDTNKFAYILSDGTTNPLVYAKMIRTTDAVSVYAATEDQGVVTLAKASGSGVTEDDGKVATPFYAVTVNDSMSTPANVIKEYSLKTGTGGTGAITTGAIAVAKLYGDTGEAATLQIATTSYAENTKVGLTFEADETNNANGAKVTLNTAEDAKKVSSDSFTITFAVPNAKATGDVNKVMGKLTITVGEEGDANFQKVTVDVKCPGT